MKNMKNSRLLTILFMLLVVVALAACGGTTADSGDTDSGEETTTTDTTTTDTTEGEAITLKMVVCCGPDVAPIYDELFEAWHAANPQYANVNVELDVTPFEQPVPQD